MLTSCAGVSSCPSPLGSHRLVWPKPTDLRHHHGLKRVENAYLSSWNFGFGGASAESRCRGESRVIYSEGSNWVSVPLPNIIGRRFLRSSGKVIVDGNKSSLYWLNALFPWWYIYGSVPIWIELFGFRFKECMVFRRGWFCFKVEMNRFAMSLGVGVCVVGLVSLGLAGWFSLNEDAPSILLGLP